MRDTLITIFGGGGFLGRHITQHLTAAGARVRIASDEASADANNE